LSKESGTNSTLTAEGGGSQPTMVTVCCPGGVAPGDAVAEGAPDAAGFGVVLAEGDAGGVAVGPVVGVLPVAGGGVGALVGGRVGAAVGGGVGEVKVKVAEAER
jgi:hypothetical protein